MIKEKSSFRDPCSFLMHDDEFYYRFMSNDYFEHYNYFIKSGLRDNLKSQNLILDFEEIQNSSFDIPKNYANLVLKTKRIPFISYPHEWSFSQYKTAALLTLNICRIALEYGMILKDASAFNIQFIGSRAVFIDLASFEIYKTGSPWKAYYQFCKHFYAPLFLGAKKNFIINKLLLYYSDGIPLKIAVSFLSIFDFFNIGAFVHLYLHSKFELSNFKSKKAPIVEKGKLGNIIQHLYSSIDRLKFKEPITTWGNYFLDNSYNLNCWEVKAAIISDYIKKLPKTLYAIDIGANDGTFSKILTGHNIYTIAIDFDLRAVEYSFLKSQREENNLLLTLNINFANPTPNFGWNNEERLSFLQRSKVDLIQALAIIHHLVISEDISFQEISKTFASLTKYVIIEFVLPEDEQVQLLLSNKPQYYVLYTQSSFEKEFDVNFKMLDKRTIPSMQRQIYLYEKR